MSLLGIGVVGLGTMGRNHVRVLNDLPGVELVGAIDPDPRARSAARAAPASGDLEELLALGIDMCVVAAPTLVAADIGLRLAEPGVHTLMEKPVTSEPQKLDACSRRLSASADWSGAWGTSRDTTRRCAPCAPAGPGRAGLGIPDRNTPPGALPGPNSRCRRGDGPGHP